MTEPSSEKPPSNRGHSNRKPGRKVNWTAVAAILFGITLLIEGARFYRESAVPKLRAQGIHIPGERSGLPEAREEIAEEFFETLSRLSDENPGKSNVELLEIALPISRELSPAPIRVEVVIENVGTKAATDVNVLVSWLGEITGIDDDAISDSEIIDGGIGDNLAKIWIERMSVDEIVRVTVEYAAYSQARDKLVLSMRQPEANMLFPWGSFTRHGDLSFPSFHLDVDPAVVDYDAIEVRISSAQTPSEVIETEALFADIIAAYEKESGIPTPTD